MVNRRDFLKKTGIIGMLPFLESLPTRALAASTDVKRIVFIPLQYVTIESEYFPLSGVSSKTSDGASYMSLNQFSGDISKIFTSARFGTVKSKMNILRGLDGLKSGDNIEIGHNNSSLLMVGAHDGGTSGTPYIGTENVGGRDSLDVLLSKSSFFSGSIAKKIMKCFLATQYKTERSYPSFVSGKIIPGDFYNATSSMITDLFSGVGSSGGTNTTVVDTLKARRSSLNYVLNQLNSISRSPAFSAQDKILMQQHSDAINALVATIPVPSGGGATPPAPVSCTKPVAGTTSPDYTRMREMADVMITAFMCQVSNIAMLYPYDGNNGPILGQSSYNYHEGVSHEGGNPNFKSDFVQYHGYEMDFISYVVKKMDSIVESNGKTMLDNSLVVVGYENGENSYVSGVRQTHPGLDYAIVTFGSLNGLLSTGNYINYQRSGVTASAGGKTFTIGRPINQFHTTILNKLGISHSGFGDYSNPTGATSGKYAEFITAAAKAASLPLL